MVLAHFKQSHSASFGKSFKHLVVEGEKDFFFFFKTSNKNRRLSGSAIINPISDITWIYQFGRVR